MTETSYKFRTDFLSSGVISADKAALFQQGDYDALYSLAQDSAAIKKQSLEDRIGQRCQSQLQDLDYVSVNYKKKSIAKIYRGIKTQKELSLRNLKTRSFADLEPTAYLLASVDHTPSVEAVEKADPEFQIFEHPVNNTFFMEVLQHQQPEKLSALAQHWVGIAALEFAKEVSFMERKALAGHTDQFMTFHNTQKLLHQTRRMWQNLFVNYSLVTGTAIEDLGLPENYMSPFKVR